MNSLRKTLIATGAIKPAYLCKPTNIVKGGDGNWHLVPDFVKA